MKASQNSLKQKEAVRSESTKTAGTLVREIARLKEIADKKQKKVKRSQRQLWRLRRKDFISDVNEA